MEIIDISATAEDLPGQVAFFRRLSRARHLDEILRALVDGLPGVGPMRMFVRVDRQPDDAFRLSLARRVDRGTGRLAPLVFEPHLTGGRVILPEDRAVVPDRPRISRGGALSLILQGEVPRVVNHPALTDDPAFAGLPTDFGALIAVPVFHEGAVTSWALLFFDAPADATPARAQLALALANLLHGVELVALSNARNAEQLADLARVQRALLPDPLPEHPRLSIAADYSTSQHAGGDFFDFISFGPRAEPTPDGRPPRGEGFGAIIADVSGHGPAAACVMAILSTILRTFDERTDPAELVHETNRRINESRLGGMFVTAGFHLILPATGKVHYVRAGHPPARLLRARTGGVESLSGAGIPPLGVLDELELRQASATLEPGDSLVLYTDGVTEAFDAQREMFSPDRLDAAIAAAGPSATPEELIASIRAALDTHRAGGAIEDDCTLVVLRFQP